VAALYESVNLPPEPDLRLAGLSIWVVARQFPAAKDFWDGNWLNIRATVDAPGAHAEFSGPRLRSDEVAKFMRELTAVNRKLSGTAALACMEPYLQATVVCGSLGQVEVTVDITPGQLTQSHHFVFAIDQSYLPKVVSDCGRILDAFPVKSDPDSS
jgi:hypothetical protein